jgi:hypothetical protein
VQQLKLRFADASEKKTVLEWALRTPEFDPSILDYPTLQTLVCYDADGPVAYLPMQRVLMLESSARREGIGDLKSINALRDLIKAAEVVASSHGIKEIYFVATDKELGAVAARNGFEELPWKTYRMKL